MFKKVAVVGSMVVASASSAFAAAQDYTAIGTGITAEITSALTTALPIGGTVLGVFIGWKVLKRFVRG